MNKYGLDAFEITEIEEVDNSIINEREEYWIAYYNTYLGEGYNGTKGGDGKQLYDYQHDSEGKEQISNLGLTDTYS